jgi:peptidoglycan/xylan/chitin deacetylase (PgdA/CDA1 family)
MSGLTSSLLRLAAKGVDLAGLSAPISVALGYARPSAAFPILSLHRVNRDDDPFFPALPTEVFERQMAFVARAYVVLPLEELVDRMGRGILPRNALAITFDDGYRDNLTHAAPILARHGLPATVFVVTGAIETGEPLWFDRLALAFKHTRAGGWMAPWGGMLPLESVGQRLAALGQTLARFKRMTNGERQDRVEDALVSLGIADERPLRNVMLSWGDVAALMGLGVTIGAHTVSHPILSQLPDGEARAEIEGSRAAIRSRCGRAPQAFAYPNGGPADYSEAVISMVRDAGFSCAVTTRFGVNTAATPPYELRRGGPWEHHLPTFALKLAGYRLTEA